MSSPASERSKPAEHYILSTGGSDVERLRLLHEVYGPGTEAMFRRAGLTAGQRVIEFGCGSGNIACWVAEQVGPTGSVVGIDNSPGQIEEARRQAARRGLTNIEFEVADAYSPKLPEQSFDIACCRLVLMHLTHPLEALKAMRSLVKPGGQVLCEEMDLGHWLCDPPAHGMSEFFRLNEELGRRRGENFDLGASLHRLFREAGFYRLNVHSNFVLALRGEVKRLLWMTFVEFAPELVREQLAEQAEVDTVAAELKQLADDETTLFGFPLIVQVGGEVKRG
ncbi:methyltransferase domain-containing protein [Planctomicrobium piriforme]|uniref:Methyltransferase domain-containing protein n=1 Tax=Planctomicrobium piriforme TaxID=1576369 RepID=A0A1I3MXB4_9PLAN|nr:methyltransferase domain-containing protein [Planctomicrobium piriforme]SFJ01599.1 Methyltransferase domain-containing protein [Planctomicrobium piriforme]